MSGEKSRSSNFIDGAAVTSVAALTQGLGQIVLLAVLARYVTQAEFGLVTATLVLIGLGRQFTEALLRPVIIQRETLTEEDIGTAALISWIFAVIALAALLGCASWVGSLFSEPDIVPVISTLSMVFLIQAPSLVAEGLLYRELMFSRIAFAEVLSFIIGYTLVGVTLAMLEQGVWALVWAYLAQTSIKCFIVVWLERKTLRIKFNYHSFRQILWMSGGFSVAKILGYIATQIDYLIVAATMSSAAVGIYGRAYQLVGMPTMLFGQVLERVMFPVYSRLQNDREKAKLYFGHAVSLSSIVMAPMSVLFIVLGPELVRIILGPDWGDTVLPLQILASTIIFRMGYKLNDPLTKATGLVFQRAIRLAIYVIAVAVGAFIGSHWGLPGVAIGVSLAIFIHFILMAQLTLRWLGASWSWFARMHLRAVIMVLCYFPIMQVTASVLRACEVGYLGVMAGVVLLFMSSVTIVVITWPGYVFNSDIRWFLRQLAYRIEPKGGSDSQCVERDGSLVVELIGLNREYRSKLQRNVVLALQSEGIPASDISRRFNQYRAARLSYLYWIYLIGKAMWRKPRVCLYQLLLVMGDNHPLCKQKIKHLIKQLAVIELIVTAYAKPGVHFLSGDNEQFAMCHQFVVSVDVTDISDDRVTRVQSITSRLKKMWLSREQ